MVGGTSLLGQRGYRGIRQQNIPNPQNWIEHLDTGGWKLDTFSGSSK